MDIEIKTSKYSFTAKDVPIISWEELKPYWKLIAQAVIEVFLESDFKPYAVRKNQKDGFYAAEWYWRMSLIDSKKYPLKHAKKFLRILMKNKGFTNAVKEFNSIKGSNWLSSANESRLRQFVYSICYVLEDYLRGLNERYL